MALKKGTTICKVLTRSKEGTDYIINEDVQDSGLCQINNGIDKLNDKQMKAVYEKYDLYKLLKP